MTDKPDTPQAELLPLPITIKITTQGDMLVAECFPYDVVVQGLNIEILLNRLRGQFGLELMNADGWKNMPTRTYQGVDANNMIPPATTVGEILKVMRDNFQSDGKEEERWIEHMDHACPHCGGSGHKDDVTPPAEPPVNETIFEKQDRVLHDMGNPQPKESNQWLREYAAKMLESAPTETQDGAPDTIWAWFIRLQEGAWIGKVCTDRKPNVETAVAYTRKDLTDAALAKARNDAIEEAIDELESGMYLTAAALISVLKTDTGEW